MQAAKMKGSLAFKEAKISGKAFFIFYSSMVCTVVTHIALVISG